MTAPLDEQPVLAAQRGAQDFRRQVRERDERPQRRARHALDDDALALRECGPPQYPRHRHAAGLEEAFVDALEVKHPSRVRPEQVVATPPEGPVEIACADVQTHDHLVSCEPHEPDAVGVVRVPGIKQALLEHGFREQRPKAELPGCVNVRGAHGGSTLRMVEKAGAAFLTTR